MVEDNFPSLPGSDLSMFDEHSLDCYLDLQAFRFFMDQFYSEEENEAILAAAADSSTPSSQLHVPVHQEITSSTHLAALNQCVQSMQNMVSPVNFLQDGYVLRKYFSYYFCAANLSG